MQREITETEIASATRHHSNNRTWYEVPSASTDSIYTLRFKGYTPVCNCQNGAENASPDGCWHKRAVRIAESRYQTIAKEERENESKLAALRELHAFNKLGFQCYQAEAFSLLK